MPHDKLLARDGTGRTMIARTVANTRASRLDQVVLVLGHDAVRIGGACPDQRQVVAEDHAEGLAASLRRGIAEAIAAGWVAAMVCLGDMPLVPAAVIDRLLDAYRDAGPSPDAVVPLAGGRRGNPVLWDRRMFPELLSLRGDAGARQVLERCRTLVIEVGDPAVLTDFDTPERLLLFGRLDDRPPPDPRS